MDLVHGLPVEPRIRYGVIVAPGEADQGHSDGGTVVDPGFVTPRLEDPMAVSCRLQGGQVPAASDGVGCNEPHPGGLS